ncbi:LPXTG cell wall anchor domain-containing protein [Carnobacterium divergens]|uniref:Gram-positive cocci surface proteins LPxTG domain-containing protein n=1 Tax=Carnobacterium divergens TaxID=2748 RepID=A0A2R8A2U9_CARDV|nr:LPXTG cell wall anchor domain-containing protein [Carnobacterium divergens]MCO6016978.1 LPXTG cell wall anchor domain-containing protein [Carnobacterium divergens]MPQ22553.1 LPXTG cell wall anchor domain-containing protein [Carnobacterium divergens]TFI62489.1 hypothetical protein CKN62_06550 [Carnobacterium divergens]TFI73573.1 hypothetical protein CKN58_06255 [Carnobacterium divergens]TFI77520.1 hypothetical protein CKN85_06250 [Carnobacterium divergens]
MRQKLKFLVLLGILLTSICVSPSDSYASEGNGETTLTLIIDHSSKVINEQEKEDSERINENSNPNNTFPKTGEKKNSSMGVGSLLLGWVFIIYRKKNA